MSDGEFLGWLAPQGFNGFRFEICDICRKKPAVWVETYNSSQGTEIRVACDDCHRDFELRYVETQGISQQDGEDLAESEKTAERPDWMKEFIHEQEQSGSIEVIGGDEKIDEELENFKQNMTEEDLDDQVVGFDNQSSSDLEQRGAINLASWSAEFIKEALFNPNPDDWLEKQGAYLDDNIDTTIDTLSQLSNNNVSSVKLSSIMCLSGVVKRFPNSKDNVYEKLSLFELDTDSIVSDFATQTKSQLN